MGALIGSSGAILSQIMCEVDWSSQRKQVLGGWSQCLLLNPEMWGEMPSECSVRMGYVNTCDFRIICAALTKACKRHAGDEPEHPGSVGCDGKTSEDWHFLLSEARRWLCGDKAFTMKPVLSVDRS